MNSYHRKKRGPNLSPFVTVIGFVIAAVGLWMVSQSNADTEIRAIGESSRYVIHSAGYEWMRVPGVGLTVIGGIMFFGGFLWFAFLRASKKD